MTVTQRKLKHSPHQPVGRWIRVDKRLAIYLRDGFVCQVCRTDLHHADPFDITLDHLIPRSRGGSNDESNLFTCCRSCNSSRQVRDLTQAQRKRVKVKVGTNLAAFRRLAKSLLGDRDGYDDGLSAAQEAAMPDLVQTCTSCDYKTTVRGLHACPSCGDAA